MVVLAPTCLTCKTSNNLTGGYGMTRLVLPKRSDKGGGPFGGRPFGLRLRNRRGDIEKTQEDVVREVNALGVGLTQGYYSKLEKKRDGALPNGAIVAALAIVLETSANYLLGLTENDAIPVELNDEESASFLSLEAEQIADMVDRMEPHSRREALSAVQTILDAELARKHDNARRWQSLLALVERTAGRNTRVAVEQEIGRLSLETTEIPG